ncbi:hypothetical protein GPA10_41175 [Streptomyces sp. p1417]|uniref:Uncharacterized protein n=2 Tax=Streptomyces typhae TaxID=2681492 RepID=A0A6L6XAQ9_9ACTN|nr:hypothetical protein [Streptomyces typhae]MVO90982.1 hypothetical protein [Streptomyces typhae]
MPNQKRNHTTAQVRAWIAQGVQRLGVDEMRLRAARLLGWQLLNASNLVPTRVQARHEQRFPKARRLLLANQAASGSIALDGMTDAARQRNGVAAVAQVDGGCPCRGTGGITLGGAEPGESYERLCPVHRAAEILAHHRARRAGA